MINASQFASERRWKQLRGLTEVSRALTYALSLREVLDLTVARAAELLEADKAVLMLTNTDGLLTVHAAHGLDRATCERFREPLHETLVTRLHGMLEVQKEHFLGVPLVVGGAVTGLLAVAHARADESLDDAEWLLSALADQAAVALEKARLDESARFGERLIGIVSHDLRNPVHAISMAAELLLQDESLDPRTTTVVSRLRIAANRATRMISDLLDFTQARLGSGIPVHRRPANIHVIARQTVDEHELAHPERRIQLSQAGDGDGEWDPDRLVQMLGNLLSNALQYGASEAPVQVDIRGQGNEVVLRVHNRGARIPEARLPHVFEPMQRATSDLSSTARSVGLGLYIVKHIAEAHRGQVSVESSDEDGTTFTVVLPRRP